MRILFLDSDYRQFLEALYRTKPGLKRRPYAVQLAALNDELLGVADFLSEAVVRLGHDAIDVHANNRWLQRAWAHEQRVRFRWERATERQQRIVAAQIHDFKPDIVFNHDVAGISSAWLSEIVPNTASLIGRIASPLPPDEELSRYDLLLSSLPHFVDRFRKLGVPAHLWHWGFARRVGEAVPAGERDVDVSFVGSLSRHHTARIAWLEAVCRQRPVSVWAPSVNHLPADSAIRRYYQGQAWGRTMYEILGRSKITLNQHIDLAGPWASNMRLFEATGMGVLLLTDCKANLEDMFRVDREVVCYRDARECVERIRHYLHYEAERASIAAAGQRRTLRDYTYDKRAAELVAILEAAT